MLNKDLSLVAATALSRCRSEHTAVTYTDIAVDCPAGRQRHRPDGPAHPAEPGEDEELMAVLFLERPPRRWRA